MPAAIMPTNQTEKRLRELWEVRNAGVASLPVPEKLAQVRRYFATVSDLSPESRAAGDGESGDSGAMRVVITTSNVDLYGTIVDSAGAVLDGFQRNPVLLWAHGMDQSIGQTPIGEVPRLYLFPDRIEADVRFFDSDPGRSIGERYARKECRGFSIGFVPVSYAIEAIDGVDVLRFTKWRLIELSATSIPANQDCLARAVDPSVDAYLGDCFERAAAASLPVDQYMVRSINEQLAGTGSVVQTVANRAAGDQPAGSPAAEQRATVSVEVEMDDVEPSAVLAAVQALADGAGLTPEDEADADAAAADAETGTNGGAGQMSTAADRGLAVDWSGLYDLRSECSAASPEQLDAMAAIVLTRPASSGRSVEVVRMWPHHRAADGTVSWLALAASMGDLISRAHDLTAEELAAAYNHLEAHYIELGVEPPEPRPHTEGEAFDVALSGRCAFIEGERAFLFVRSEDRGGVTVPVFRCTTNGEEVAFSPPAEGRFTNHTLWGQRQLPARPEGIEAVLERLAVAQEQILALHEQRAGQEFSRRNRQAIQQLAASLEGIGKSLAVTRKQCLTAAASLRALVSEGQDGGENDRSLNGDGDAGRDSSAGSEPASNQVRPLCATPDQATRDLVAARRRRTLAGISNLAG